RESVEVAGGEAPVVAAPEVQEAGALEAAAFGHRLRLVVTEVGGQPIEGAQVQVATVVNGKDVIEDLLTDAEGVVDIEVGADAEQRFTTLVGKPGFQSATYSRFFTPGTERTEHLSLERGMTIVAQLVDVEGEPASGLAFLQITEVLSGSEVLLEMGAGSVIGAGGRAEFSLEFDEFEPSEVMVEVRQRDAGRSAPVRLMLGGLDRYDLGEVVLEAEAPVTGQVRLGDGTPLGSEQVQIGLYAHAAGDERRRPLKSSRLDTAGRFEITGLEPGEYDAVARCGYTELPGGMATNVGPGAFVELVVDALWVDITATDGDGEPVELSAIEFAQAGQLALSRLPQPDGVERPQIDLVVPRGEDVWVLTQHRGVTLSALLDGSLPVGRHALVLEPEGVDAGTVSVSLAGVPVDHDVVLDLRLTPDGDGWPLRESVRVDAGKAASLEGVLPGRYSVRATVQHAEWGQQAVFAASEVPDSLVVVAGEESPLRLPVLAKAMFEARIVPPAEDGGARARISLRERDATAESDWRGLPLVWFTERNGSRRRSGGTSSELDCPTFPNYPITPGAYDLRIEVDGYRTEIVAVDLVAGEVTPVEVDLVRGV
ncbi:MAG: hypothetical protein AAFZ65_09580, partial [Planctomycetota bacterium]